MRYLVLLLLAGQAMAADVTSTRDTPYDFQTQTAAGLPITNHTRFDTAFVACLNNPACAFVQGGRYRVNRGVVPTPIDCVVSAWTETAGAWSACSAGTRTRQITRTRSVVTPATNGGQACPVLGETFPQSEACTVTPPATGTASLTWQPPTVWPDGSPVTGALTYRVEYGRGNFATQVPATGLAYNVTALASGSWQFRLYAMQGARVSNPSNTVTKVIP